jgi:ABC-2 type transport system permease protein
MMGAKIAGFEFRYQLRNPVFWVAFAAFFMVTFGLVTSGQIRAALGSGVHTNAPIAIARLTGATSIFAIFILVAFIATAIVRDDETGFGPILRATGVAKRDYLFGRFFGALLISILAYCGAPLGMLFGALMPWLDPETLGPFRPADYVFALFVVAVPTLFIVGSGLFTLATATRSMMASYVGAVVFLALYALVVISAGKPEYQQAAALGDPFAVTAISTTTKYWTAVDYNTMRLPIEGVFLWNRLIWFGVALVMLAIAYVGFRFESRGVGAAKPASPETAAPTPLAAVTATATPRFDRGQRWQLLWARIGLDVGGVLRSPAFLVLLLIGLVLAFGRFWLGRLQYGNPSYPETRYAIEALYEALGEISAIVAIYYGGELVWRDRDRRIHEIIDASPIPDWAFLLPKILAIGIVLVALEGAAILGALALQASRGYFDFEFGHYLLWFLLPYTIGLVQLAVLSIFVQTLSPGKYIGFGVMALYVVARLTLPSLGFEHHLYLFGTPTAIPLSDMNGQGNFWVGRMWFEAYWTASCVVLAILSYGLWRRGTETRFWPRLRRLPRLLAGPAGAIMAASLVTWAGLGGFIFYNTNILNPYITALDDDRWAADYEKAILPFAALPQPNVTDVQLNVDIEPHVPQAMVTGNYAIVNRTGAPLSAVHLSWNRDLRDIVLTVDGARVDQDFGRLAYRIYAFDPPMAPGETRHIHFTTRWARPGFRNEDPVGMTANRVVDNGTFINNFRIAPFLGVFRQNLLTDQVKRRKYGLPPELPMPKLEDDSARAANQLRADWVSTDIAITTTADQTPLAPGYQVSDEIHDGRRTARFKSDAPILDFFSIQSAAYETHTDRLGDIELTVFSDPSHRYNVPTMLAAMKTSLEFYSRIFSPYQFHQARIAEVPYGDFAQSFANTIPFAENLGFLVEHTDPDKVDIVTYATAHEIAHQWWFHQVVPADMQGSTMLTETFAQYSALLTMEKLYGKAQIRKFLKYELDNYLRSRGRDLASEQPLVRVENQPYIHYRKGAVVMYFLKEELGEDTVDRALRRLLAEYAFKPAPYPSSKDFVRYLREEAGPAHDQLITDLFERITLYDIKTGKCSAAPRPDGKFDVTIEVEAHKIYADGRGQETEAPLAEDFDIGLFDIEPGKAGFGDQAIVLATRRPIVSGKQVLSLVADHAPKFAGVDPYNERITRNSDTVIGKVEMRAE